MFCKEKCLVLNCKRLVTPRRNATFCDAQHTEPGALFVFYKDSLAALLCIALAMKNWLVKVCRLLAQINTARAKVK